MKVAMEVHDPKLVQVVLRRVLEKDVLGLKDNSLDPIQEKIKTFYDIIITDIKVCLIIYIFLIFFSIFLT